MSTEPEPVYYTPEEREVIDELFNDTRTIRLPVTKERMVEIITPMGMTREDISVLISYLNIWRRAKTLSKKEVMVPKKSRSRTIPNEGCGEERSL